MITLIGAAHVFDISDRIREEIIKREPNVVAVELDNARYHALKSGKRGGRLPFIYRLLHKVQKRLAEKFDVEVGEEMITATETAKEINAKIALIDLPANQILNKLMNKMSFKEKIYLIGGGILGLFTTKEKIEREMERYHSDEEGQMIDVGKKMPAVMQILIRDRNRHMAKNLIELEKKFGSVVAVVGDGHVTGMKKRLKDRELEVVRLKEIMRSSSTEKEENENKVNNTEVNYTFYQKLIL